LLRSAARNNHEVLGFRHPISDAELDLESPLPPGLLALIVALGGAEQS
jgi:hypothetical protein